MRYPAIEVHAALISALQGTRVTPLPLEPEAEDFRDRADYVRAVANAIVVWAKAQARDVSANSRMRIIPTVVENAILGAFEDELIDPIEQAEADAEAAFLDAAE